jgi:HTH-type transcriptional regulator/antitoxin HigA
MNHPRNEFEPDYSVAPGTTLRATLAAQGMTQTDLSMRTGLSLKHVNQIAQGLAPISPETALALERVTEVPAPMWNSLEARYRGALAREADAKGLAGHTQWLRKLPVAELVERGHLEPGLGTADRVAEVCRFFRVASPQQWERVWLEPLAAFRQSPSFASDAAAVATWLRLGELEAATVECQPYDARGFRDALSKVRGFTRMDPASGANKLVSLGASFGVAVVFVEEIARTRVSGAARWLTPTKAVIQLSLRYKREDHLWFSLFHEAGHVLLHSKKQTFVDRDSEHDTLEDEANLFAATQLIPRKYERELASLSTTSEVEAFAERIGIAPGIVVGRLQREGLWPWNKGNSLRRRVRLGED